MRSSVARSGQAVERCSSALADWFEGVKEWGVRHRLCDDAAILWYGWWAGVPGLAGLPGRLRQPAPVVSRWPEQEEMHIW